jgi:chloramphenicol 3-O-phosphotransferase
MDAETKRQLCKTLFETMLLLRNGAIVAGKDSVTQAFREKCLEQCYYTLSTDIIPELAKAGVADIYNDEQWGSVCDMALLHRKNAMP